MSGATGPCWSGAQRGVAAAAPVRSGSERIPLASGNDMVQHLASAPHRPPPIFAFRRCHCIVSVNVNTDEMLNGIKK